MYTIMIQIDEETKKKAVESFMKMSNQIAKGRTRNILVGKSNDGETKKKNWTPYNYIFMGHRGDIKYTGLEE